MAIVPILESKGFRIIDVDHWKYRDKKGRDFIVEVKGERASLEIKRDDMSEKTDRVCIDLDSMSKTQSKYWIFGLPDSGRYSLYAMYFTQLRDFVQGYIKTHPDCLKRVGEFKAYCAFIPKHTFITQPFISNFGTIVIQ